MRRSILASMAVAVVVLSASAASADPLVGQTNLTIHRAPPGQVNAGDTVTIYGKLVGYPPCRGGQPISLLQVGSGTVATTTTDGAGNYAFSRTVSQTTSFQTEFDGATIGTHPNEQVCAASVSPVLKVRVKGSHGASASAHGSADQGPQRPSTRVAGTTLPASNLGIIAAIAVVVLAFGGLVLVPARRRR
ncbi:MAG: hypothetical protein ACM3OO_11640 [Planctomycetaceae bacterium]